MYMYGQNVTVHIAKYILYIPNHSPAHVTNINCAHIELSLKYNYTSLIISILQARAVHIPCGTRYMIVIITQNSK